jgi:hypothetical protein
MKLKNEVSWEFRVLLVVCLVVLINLGEEQEDFLWGKGVEVSFTKLDGQFEKDRLVGFDGVFFE